MEDVTYVSSRGCSAEGMHCQGVLPEPGTTNEPNLRNLMDTDF